MIRKILYLSFLLLLNLPIYGQLQVTFLDTHPGLIEKKKTSFDSQVITYDYSYPSEILSPSACADNFALFCRLELQLEKATNIPVLFRLGSLQYVDWLEGKSETYLYER